MTDAARNAPTVTHLSRRMSRVTSRTCHTVTNGEVTGGVTVPPTRPDPTSNYNTPNSPKTHAFRRATRENPSTA